MLKDYCYPAIFSYEGKYINLRFPDIAEAYTFAESEAELWECAKEVLSMSIEGRIEDKEDIPEASKISDIKLENDENIVLITVTVDTKIKYVKKTLTIPESLNIQAMKNGINFSETLKESLLRKLSNVD